MKAQIGFALAITLLASSAHAAGYKVQNLVSSQPGVALQQDTDLVNPWGLCQDTDTAPVWASDNGSAKSTFYDRTSGVKQFPIVAIPNGLPTGCVSVPFGITFTMSEHGLNGRAYFLFDSISGAITGWAPGVDENNAIIGVDNGASGAVYTGLALDTTNQHLLAANFAKNSVEIYDTTFTKLSSFTDPDLPKKFGPFNVAVVGSKVYVAFAKQQKPKARSLKDGGVARGKTLGLIDVFDTAGNLQQRLITGGNLNAPWGMGIAPANFGAFAGALLVGNFGNGQINAYDATTGDFLGTVGNKKGKALKFDGLWAIDPGPGKATVTISAGVNDEADGLIALIKPN
jgi:uncharacterized protein (TIGR03118 family)